MDFSRRYEAICFRNLIDESLPGYAAKHLDSAIAGDCGAASALVASSPNELRGVIAVYFYLVAAPLSAYRSVLSDAWIHDYGAVVAASKTIKRLRAMFRQAAFPIPDSLPDPVRIYRGTSGVSFKTAGKGHSWTIDRDTACWFAMRFAEYRGSPLVISADIQRKNILYYTNDRGEGEVVCSINPKYSICGNKDAWVEGANRFGDSNIARFNHKESLSDASEMDKKLNELLDV